MEKGRRKKKMWQETVKSNHLYYKEYTQIESLLYLLILLSVSLMWGNFSLKVSFMSFLRSEGLTYSMTVVWEEKPEAVSKWPHFLHRARWVDPHTLVLDSTVPQWGFTESWCYPCHLKDQSGDILYISHCQQILWNQDQDQQWTDPTSTLIPLCHSSSIVVVRTSASHTVAFGHHVRCGLFWVNPTYTLLLL